MIDEKNNSKLLPMILVILDGWGIANENKGNAITLARTPIMDKLLEKYQNTLLCAHGSCVGLPDGQVGNSEAGHTNIGAGRVVDQEVVRITKSIEDGTFFKISAFLEAIRHIKKTGGRLHMMGLLSNGMSPHSDPKHLLALLKFAKEQGVSGVCLHLFTDGRDSNQYASLKLVNELESSFTNGEVICSISGRFFAMDRKKKWDRTEKAYDSLLIGSGRQAESAQAAITEAYNRGESDEFIAPYVIVKDGEMTPRISDNDSVIFFNLRSDRGRQLTKVFVQEEFNKKNPGSFHRKRRLKDIKFVAMTDFGPDLGDSLLTAFPSFDIRDTLPMCLKDLRQLYIAESEKYAHVTYFFNGGYPQKVANEDYIMIPSPDVRSYDETPEMKTKELTDIVVEKGVGYDFTVLNFSAPDMIGHTGNLTAGIKCCEIVDENLGRIIDAYLEHNGTVLVTADHGNIECMLDLVTDEIMTEHTTNPVPFIVVNKRLKDIKLRKGGVSGDIAPTILHLLNVEKPQVMTGKSLIID